MQSKNVFDAFTQTIALVGTTESNNKFTQTSSDDCSTSSLSSAKKSTATQTLNQIVRDFSTQTELKSSLKPSTPSTAASTTATIRKANSLTREKAIVSISDDELDDASVKDNGTNNPMMLPAAAKSKKTTTGSSIESNWPVTNENRVINLGRLTRSEESLMDEEAVLVVSEGSSSCGAFRNRNLTYRDNRDNLNRLFKKPSLESLSLKTTTTSTAASSSNKGKSIGN